MGKLTKTIGLWDAKWTKHLLQEKVLEIGVREFARGWQQKAISDDEVMFKEEALQESLDTTRQLYFPVFNDVFPKGSTEKVYMGVDLAIAQASKTSDYFVITVIAVDQREYGRRIVGLFRDRHLSFNKQLTTIEMWSDYFNPEVITVENNAYQDALVQELHRTTALPVVPFTTTAIKKRDLLDGLPRLSVEFENNKWSLPYKNKPTRELIDSLLEELRVYPISAVHDDCIMALWFSRCAYTMNIAAMRKQIRFI